MYRSILAFFLLAAVLVSAGAPARRVQTRTDSLMAVLDDVIARRPEYLQEKTERIAGLESRLRLAAGDRERFECMGLLFDEYAAFNSDSALAYCRRREAVASRMGDAERLLNARMNYAATLCIMCMYKEALDIMDSIRISELPWYLHPYYYHIYRTAYGNLCEYAALEPLRGRYRQLTEIYRDSLLMVNEPGSLAYAITLADALNAEGRYGEALESLGAYIDSARTDEHQRAICAWTLAESYGHLGDTAAMKEQLIISSIGDMKSATREYISLRQLALLLFHEGDLERAYRFLNIALEDAAACNARQRIVELNNSFPQINGIYLGKIRQQSRSLMWMVVAAIVLLGILVFVALRLRKGMGELRRSRKAAADANERLNQANTALSESNAALSAANRDLNENSRLKEVYIGRYMDQCMTYIERLDNYRKSLGRLDAIGRHEELQERLKSPEMVEQEFRGFYRNFDETFLGMFPDFISELNGLLRPGEEVQPRRDGSLTPELRIFALIRLGISDSDRIARFLRYSVSTIYNYRTRMRNKARGDRAALESEIMKIGRSES